jgi:hypothetical protein
MFNVLADCIMEKKFNVLHAGKSKALSVGNAYENERRGWTEESYRAKNANPINNYDWSRHNLNFEIVDGEIVPLGRQKKTLYTRFQDKLESVGYKAYKDGASNSQNTYVEIIFSANTEKMQKIAFGNQSVNYERNPENWHNWDVRRSKEIEQWGKDVYNFGISIFGKDSIIGCELHLDETEPHIHMNIVPLAERKQRGNVGGYVKIDKDGNDVRYSKGKHVGELIKLSKGKYDKLSDEKKAEYRPAVRGTVYTVSYAAHFGSTTKERSEAMSQLHDKFYEEVGKKWGFERGEVWAELTEEEKAKKRRRTKAEAYKEKQAKERTKEAEESREKAEERREKAEAIAQEAEKEAKKWGKMLFKDKTEEFASLASLQLEGSDFKTELQNTLDELVTLCQTPKKSILQSDKEWKKEQHKKAKAIVTRLNDRLFSAKGLDYALRASIKEIGKTLYADAKKEIADVLEENQRLEAENEKLKKEIKDVQFDKEKAVEQGRKAAVKKILDTAVFIPTNKKIEEVTPENIGNAMYRVLDERNKAVVEKEKWEKIAEELKEQRNNKYVELQEQFAKHKKALQEKAEEKERDRVKAVRELAEEKEAAARQKRKHQEHLNTIKKAIATFIDGDMEKLIEIILRQMAKDVDDFVYDTMVEIKEILFGRSEDIQQRKVTVSNSFVWAKVLASVEGKAYRHSEELLKDALRIADGTWQSWRDEKERLHTNAADVIDELDDDMEDEEERSKGLGHRR